MAVAGAAIPARVGPSAVRPAHESADGGPVSVPGPEPRRPRGTLTDRRLAQPQGRVVVDDQAEGARPPRNKRLEGVDGRGCGCRWVARAQALWVVRDDGVLCWSRMVQGAL